MFSLQNSIKHGDHQTLHAAFGVQEDRNSTQEAACMALYKEEMIGNKLEFYL